MQVSVAPFDVRQGNFVGAGVNTVTRSGTNTLTGSVYYRFRNESFVGTEADGQRLQPRHVRPTDSSAVGLGGPIIKNRLFVFGSFEDEPTRGRCTTFVANPGGEPVGGNIDARAGVGPRRS